LFENTFVILLQIVIIMKGFFLGLIAIFGSFVLTYAMTYFMAYVTLDIIHLYSIPYLINLSIANIFGFWFAYTLFTTKRSELSGNLDKKTQKDQGEFFKNDLKTQITYFVFICLVWGISILTHKIFF
jgi:hypothetical protein